MDIDRLIELQELSENGDLTPEQDDELYDFECLDEFSDLENCLL